MRRRGFSILGDWVQDFAARRRIVFRRAHRRWRGGLLKEEPSDMRTFPMAHADHRSPTRAPSLTRAIHPLVHHPTCREDESKYLGPMVAKRTSYPERILRRRHVSTSGEQRYGVVKMVRRGRGWMITRYVLSMSSFKDYVCC